VTDFTIVLPTTKDRAPVLEPVLRHVQLQTLSDWELFIIGDGVSAETRDVVERWCREDSRIRFFDHPKHPRRGEPYRNEALAQARGRNVAYLCDRDLWLYDHLETLALALEGADFVHARPLSIGPEGRLDYLLDVDLAGYRRGDPSQRQLPVMSSVAHSLASYRRLPFGWRTTPEGIYTDCYMWQQFLDEDWCRAQRSSWPTLLYFNRGSHPGWPSAQRGEELQRWHARLSDVDAQRRFRADAMRELATPANRARQAWRSWLSGHPKVQRAYAGLRDAIR